MNSFHFKMRPYGSISLENGELIFRKFDGTQVGRLFVGPDTPVFEGEVTIFQESDPPALRFASRYAGWRGALGKLSFNVARSDDRQEEVSFLKGTLAEDVEPGEHRGQFEVRLRASEDANDMPIAWIATTAYSEGLFGVRKVWTGFRNLIDGLFKFE